MKRRWKSKKLIALLLSAAVIFQRGSSIAAETDLDSYVFREEEEVLAPTEEESVEPVAPEEEETPEPDAPEEEIPEAVEPEEEIPEADVAEEEIPEQNAVEEETPEPLVVEEEPSDPELAAEPPVVVMPQIYEIFPYYGTGKMGPVQPGDVVTYEIHYTNFYEEPKDIEIVVPLDGNVELSDFDDAAKDDFEDGILYWALPKVPAGTDGIAWFRVLVRDTALEQGYIRHHAVVTIDGEKYETGKAENMAINAIYLRETSPYDSEDALGEVSVGEKLTYEIQYWNYKEETANISITDPLDWNVKFISADCGGTYDEASHSVQWNLNSIPADKTDSVTVTVEVTENAREAKQVSHSAYLSVGDDDFVFEAGELVNEVKDSDTLSDPHLVELSPYKGSEDLGAVIAGQKITYEIRFMNDDDVPADVEIWVDMDRDMRFISADQGGVYGVDEAAEPDEDNYPYIKWLLKDFPAKTEGKVQFTLAVARRVEDVYVSNSATVYVGDQPGKKTETVTNYVKQRNRIYPYLKFDGTNGLPYLVPGKNGQFTVFYKNESAQKAPIKIELEMDGGLQIKSMSNDGSWEDDIENMIKLLSWEIPDVPAGAAGSVTFTVRPYIEESLPEGLSFTAVVQTGKEEPAETNTLVIPVIKRPVITEVDPYEGSYTLGLVKPGQEITCYLSVWNYELTDEDVTVYIRLDDTELICSDPEFSYDEETGLHHLTLPNMSPGEEFDIEYTVKVKDDVQDQSLITTEGYVQIKNHKEPFENYVSHLVDSTAEDNYLVENDPYFGKGDLGNIPIDRFVEYSVFYCNSTAEKADVRVSVILDENTEMSENSAAEYDPETGEYYWIAEAVPAGGKGYFVFHAAALRDALDAGIVTQRAYVQIGDGERIALRPVTNRVINVISIREIAPYVGTGQLGYVPCGSEITYEITVRNYKDTTVDAEVEVFMDESLSYVSTKPGNYKVNDESDDTYTRWDIQGMAPGAEVKIIFTARVKDNAAELISCSAFVRLGEDPFVESDAITNTTLEDQAPPAVEPPASPTAAPTVAPSATPSAEEQKTSPPTGDNTPITLYVMLLAVSALGAAAVQKRRRAE